MADSIIEKNPGTFIIPNPIYDVVFRYLMEDTPTAKIVLSILLGKKITDLVFEPQDYTHKLDVPNKKEENITIFHLDFAATIEMPDGKKEIVLIELQKAKEPADLFRFKRYLAKNLQKKFVKQVKNPKTGALDEVELTYRIFPIYIFNFIIESEIKDLILSISREKKGLFTRKKLEGENDFIENISYDVLIVQLPYLTLIKESDYADDYRKKLYHLLQLFNQSRQIENRHRLLLIRKLFPGHLDRIIRRLQSADLKHPDLEEQMNIEDEYLRPIRNRDNEICFLREKIEEKDQVIEENVQQLEKKDQRLLESAIMMKNSGIDPERIVKITGLSHKEIKDLPEGQSINMKKSLP